MLISFACSNFLSIRDRVELSFLPDGVSAKTHAKHLAPACNTINALRVGVIFGANASGKSNILKALRYAVKCVRANSCVSTLFKPFMLDEKSRNEPSSFEFVFSSGRHVYRYSFSTDGQAIVSESLHWIKQNGKNEATLFARDKEATVSWDARLSVDPWYKWRTLESTRLVLPKLEEDGIRVQSERHLAGSPYIIEALDFFRRFRFWGQAFADGIDDGGLHRCLASEGAEFQTFFRNLLRVSDLGIDDVSWDEMPRPASEEMLAGFPPFFRKPANGGKTADFITHFNLAARRFYYFKRDSETGDFTGFELKTVHRGVHFDISQESEGTFRLIQMAALLWDIMGGDRIWIIDEFENALHSLLAAHLLRQLLEGGNAARGQMVIATHCLSLLSSDILRKDEVWMSEKRPDGSTDLYPLTKLNPRSGANFAKGYMGGAYGAVPVPGDFFINPSDRETGNG